MHFYSRHPIYNVRLKVTKEWDREIICQESEDSPKEHASPASCSQSLSVHLNCNGLLVHIALAHRPQLASILNIVPTVICVWMCQNNVPCFETTVVTVKDHWLREKVEISSLGGLTLYWFLSGLDWGSEINSFRETASGIINHVSPDAVKE